MSVVLPTAVLMCFLSSLNVPTCSDAVTRRLGLPPAASFELKMMNDAVLDGLLIAKLAVLLPCARSLETNAVTSNS